MIKIKIDQVTFLVVDFGGRVTIKEEEDLAYRFIGKSNQTIGQILGKSADTVHKQLCKAYKKTDVDGTDNPLALLQCKAFKNGWAKFAVVVMITLACAPTLRSRARTTTGGTRTAFNQIARRTIEA